MAITSKEGQVRFYFIESLDDRYNVQVVTFIHVAKNIERTRANAIVISTEHFEVV